VYDSREFRKDPNDPVNGRQISASFGLAGIGGDVRTISPSISWSQYIPVRIGRPTTPRSLRFEYSGECVEFCHDRKDSDANSLAFVDGVPIFERFFLGDELQFAAITSIHWSNRPLETFVTSRTSHWRQTAPGLPCRSQSAGVTGEYCAFTGASVQTVHVSNRLRRLARHSGTWNFEYRVNLFGPVSMGPLPTLDRP